MISTINASCLLRSGCFFTKFCFCVTAILVAGCQTSGRPGFTSLVETGAVHYRHGNPFRHLVVEEPADIATPAGDWLHVYIEGDGVPWINHTGISADPTPRYPLALHLMSLDSGRALYLGRPCYFNTADPGCTATLWTDGRYAETVVDSMTAVLEDYCRTNKVALIGYSGGGVLAVLISRKLPCAALVVTIAANLDIDAWTDYHGYLPLRTSVNPATLGRTPGVGQLHLVGGRDHNVPVATARSFFQGAGLIPTIYPLYNHTCCWVREWPQILRRIDIIKISGA